MIKKIKLQQEPKAEFVAPEMEDYEDEDVQLELIDKNNFEEQITALIN